MHCANCQFRITRSRVHRLCNESDQVVERVRRWVYPHDITGDDYLCHSCWELINHSSNEGQEQLLGYHNVCAGCGRSILRIRSRLVLGQHQISNIISEWIRPRQLTPDDEICIPCYLRARRVLERRQRSSGPTAPSTSQGVSTQSEQIVDVVPQPLSIH